MPTKNAVDTTLVGQTGTGAFAGSNSPIFVTPSLGAASADSLLLNSSYSLPTSDGTAGQVLTTTGLGVTSFQNAATGTINNATNLGGGTATFAGVSGTDLTFNTYTAGANISFNTVGNLTTISASGAGITFPYTNAFWVSQFSGSDTNLGTSIDTPFLTVQHAITASGVTPTTIYVVDSDVTNTETISTTGAGQSITIFAPGTVFAGSFTIIAADITTIISSSVNNLTNYGSTYIDSSYVINSTNAGLLSLNTLYIYSRNILGLTCSGGTTYIDVSTINTFSLTTNAVAYLSAQNYTGITNDGTGILNGVTGGVLPGINGSFQIPGQFIGDSIAFSDTTHGIVGTTIADNAATGYVGEFITNVISSPVSTTNNSVVNVGSITVGAGDWDIYGQVAFANTAGVMGQLYVWTSLTSSTEPVPYLKSFANNNDFAQAPYGLPAPFLRVNRNVPTVVYLSAKANFNTGAGSFTGVISARRIR